MNNAFVFGRTVLNRRKPNRLKRFGRILFIAIYFTCLALTVASILPRFRYLSQPYAGDTFDFLRLTTRYLPTLGIAPNAYAGFAIFSEILWVGIPLFTGLIILIRRPNELYPQFCAVMLVAFTFTGDYLSVALRMSYPILVTVENALQAFALAGFTIFLFTFPNGKSVPKASWIVSAIWSALLVYFVLFPNTPGSYLQPELVWQRPVFAVVQATFSFTFGFLAQIYRYFKFSSRVERQQTKWLNVGMIVFFVGWGLRSAAIGFSDVESLWTFGLVWVGSYMMLAVPITFSFAIMRYRLWDIDLILSRTLVYSLLMALTVAFYVGIVVALQRWLATPSPLAGGVALVISALLFQPLRDRLQAVVQRYLFGDRNNPMQVLGELGQRLEDVVDSAEMLPTIVDSIKTSLRVPYAAIALREGSHFIIATQQGTITKHLLKLPLVFQGSKIGELHVAQRTAADPFDPYDLALLETVAQQAGPAVHAVQLTRELRHSRQTIVTAREEERRRLRRDLHDGLGPTLAAQVFHVGVARSLIHKNPDAAEDVLKGLEGSIENMLADVRDVVYGLRPPMLDQLGFASSIQELCQTLNAPFELTLNMPDQMPLVSAAAEVAAFRIVQTALDNVAQHANAKNCIVSLAVSKTALTLELVDDGIGIDPNQHIGVGLTSMRERAEELGGAFSIAKNHPQGTRIVAVLPLLNAQPPTAQGTLS